MSRRIAVALIGLVSLSTGVVALAHGADSKPVLCRGMEATVVGTSEKDDLGPESTRRGDVVALLAGADRFVLGRATGVTVCGGKGGDELNAGKHFGREARLVGGPGSDQMYPIAHARDDKPLHLIGGPGNDLMHGGQADDRIVGDGSADIIGGGAGNDYIDAGGGDDLPVAGDAGDDRIDGGLGDDTIYGGKAYVDRRPPGERDKADGGKGRDYCVVRTAISCERDHR